MMQELWEIVLNGAVGMQAQSRRWSSQCNLDPHPYPSLAPLLLPVPPTNSFSVSPNRCWLLLPATKNNWFLEKARRLNASNVLYSAQFFSTILEKRLREIKVINNNCSASEKPAVYLDKSEANSYEKTEIHILTLSHLHRFSFAQLSFIHLGSLILSYPARRHYFLGFLEEEPAARSSVIFPECYSQDMTNWGLSCHCVYADLCPSP